MTPCPSSAYLRNAMTLLSFSLDLIPGKRTWSSNTLRTGPEQFIPPCGIVTSVSVNLTRRFSTREESLTSICGQGPGANVQHLRSGLMVRKQRKAPRDALKCPLCEMEVDTNSERYPSLAAHIGGHLTGLCLAQMDVSSEEAYFESRSAGEKTERDPHADPKKKDK